MPRDFRPVRTGGRRPNLGPGAYRRDGDLMAGLIPAVRRMVFALLLPCLVLATPAAADAPLRESFDLRVPVAPVAVPVDGQRLLRYELHLAHFASQPLAPTRIDVRDADRGAVIARIEGPELSRSLAIPGARSERRRGGEEGDRSCRYRWWHD